MTQRILLRAMLALWTLGVLLVAAAVGIGTLIRAQEITFTTQQNGFPVLASVDVSRHLTIILLSEPGVSISNGAWSPDSTRLAFISDRSGNPELYLLDNDAWQQLTHTAEGEYSPSWSSDGRLIIFTRSGLDISSTIEQIDLTTGLQNPAIEDNGIKGVWSPDGSHLAYATSGEIRVVDLATGVRHSITMQSSVLSSPSWSPDSSRLVFDSGSPVSDLYLYTLQTGEITPVIQTLDLGELMASWSPDGTHLAYLVHLPTVSNSPGQLWMIDLTTGERQRLNNWRALYVIPSWRP